MIVVPTFPHVLRLSLHQFYICTHGYIKDQLPQGKNQDPSSGKHQRFGSKEISEHGLSQCGKD